VARIAEVIAMTGPSITVVVFGVLVALVGVVLIFGALAPSQSIAMRTGSI